MKAAIRFPAEVREDETAQSREVPEWAKAKKILFAEASKITCLGSSPKELIMRNLQNKKVYAEIMERLQNIKPESPRLWGKMTAHQMICHLTDAFRGVMGKKHVAPTGTLFQRAVVKRLMLNLPPMPVRNYPTSPEIDQEIGGTTPAEFGADMEKLYSIIFDFIRDGDEFRRWSHPFFGSLSRREW